jgi:hypothetical protein
MFAGSAETRQLRCHQLETVIVDVFAVMNKNLAATPFSFCEQTGWTIPEFLALFDAIFTLNQDLLLEKHYLILPPVGLSLVSHGKWDLGVLPGMNEISDPAMAGFLFEPLQGTAPP